MLKLFEFQASFSRIYVVTDNLENACKAVLKRNQDSVVQVHKTEYFEWDYFEPKKRLTLKYKYLTEPRKGEVFDKIYTLERVTEEPPFVIEDYNDY